jgi:hypothetical protein
MKKNPVKELNNKHYSMISGKTDICNSGVSQIFAYPYSTVSILKYFKCSHC